MLQSNNHFLGGAVILFFQPDCVLPTLQTLQRSKLAVFFEIVPWVHQLREGSRSHTDLGSNPNSSHELLGKSHDSSYLACFLHYKKKAVDEVT